MAHYFVSKVAQPNGDHAVHTSMCRHLPTSADREYLGAFGDCGMAIAAARVLFRQVNGCASCATACHTR
jgi:hypothetical protein